jgi:ABC-type Zn uptake system ZnuABC Zn-binding protein ZnuA
MNTYKKLTVLLCSLALLSACTGQAASQPTQPSQVLAAETFLADIAQNVAGDRLKVDALMPAGLDPHSYTPTPQDVVRIAGSKLLIVNGAHFEEWLQETLDNAGGQRSVVEASAGLTSRTPSSNEILDPDHAGDPHFWLDPNNVIRYAENIRDGLIALDPPGREVYTQNAAAYIQQLHALDSWIVTQVAQIPPERRLLVTNHESFGYFADRYGFTILGTVIPSTSSEASPSALQMAALIDLIKARSVPAIFLETGANPRLAEQVAAETGARVVTDLNTHSITVTGGTSDTYIEMMKHNVELLLILK